MSLNYDSIDWGKVLLRGGEGHKLRAKIDWAKLEEFIVSEMNRGCCTFTTEGVYQAPPKPEGARVKVGERLYQGTWRCCFGGHRRLRRSEDGAPGAIPPPREGKERRRKSEHGESIKQPGCLCR